MQGLLRSFGAIDRLPLNRATNLLAAFQGRGQTLATLTAMATTIAVHTIEPGKLAILVEAGEANSLHDYLKSKAA